MNNEELERFNRANKIKDTINLCKSCLALTTECDEIHISLVSKGLTKGMYPIVNPKNGERVKDLLKEILSNAIQELETEFKNL